MRQRGGGTASGATVEAVAADVWADGLAGRGAFFVSLAALGFLAALTAPGDPDGAYLLAALAALVATLVLGLAQSRLRLPDWTRLAGAAAFFGMVFLLREAGGDQPTSAVVPLVLVIVVSFALSASLALTMVTCAMAVAVLVIPILTIGAPAYPQAEWGRVLIWGSLLPAVAILVNRLVTSLRERARSDPLTGAANGAVFVEALEAALVRSARSGVPISVGILDLDHFKRVNDTLGHVAGDRALVEAVEVWRAQLRETDLLARIGGEEFAVLLEDAPLPPASAAGERMRLALPGSLTVSIGFAQWDEVEPAEELMRRADEAMYDAKAAGRDRVRYHGQIETGRFRRGDADGEGSEEAAAAAAAQAARVPK